MSVIEMPRPLDFKGQALEFVNQVRTELDMEPITALRCGHPRKASDCSLANCFEGMIMTVTGTSLTWYDMTGPGAYGERATWELPDGVKEFVANFDMREYPELIGD